MTYWVIAKAKDKIYMAADIRASYKIYVESPLGIGGITYDFQDGSEKLFYTEYKAYDNNIKIGICTSGFASGNFSNNDITIANLLNSYMQHILALKSNLNNYYDVLKSFYNYLEGQEKGLGDFIFAKASFGIGMYFNESISIGGWNSQVNLKFKTTQKGDKSKNGFEGISGSVH